MINLRALAVPVIHSENQSKLSLISVHHPRHKQRSSSPIDIVGLPLEMQSSTSQAPVSSSPSGGPTGGPSTPTAPAPVPPPFYYNVLPNASITSGSSQQSSSGSSVAMSNPSVSTMIVQPPVPSLSSSTGPSFMYMSHAGAGLPSGQQFQPSMRIAPGPPQVGNNALTYAAALPQSPDPGQSGHTNSFVSGTCLPLPVPSPSSSNSPRFSFYGNVQLVPKDQPLKSSSSTTMAQDAGVLSPAPSISQFGSIPFSTYSGSTNTASSTLNLGSESSCSPVAVSFPAPPGMAGIPGTPGPPGVAQAAPFSSNTTVSTVSVDSSSSVLKSVMPTTPFLSNPVVQQQLYPTYHSLPPTAASPPVWLQSRPMANLARPPFVSYPVAIPGPYPLVAMPLPSVSLPDSNPPGVTPVGSAGTSYGASVHQLASGLEVQQELAPPGIDNSKKVNDIGIKEGATIAEQFDAWTAHKTDSGVVYYYNAVTGESTYEKPSGFKGEPDKVTVQPTPVAWEKLDGTDWALVTTNDGKRYYYSMKTKLSSWQIPSEVTELKKKEDGGVLKEQSVLNNILPAEKGSSPISLPTPAINTGGRDAAALRSSVLPGSSSALDLIKKKLQDSGAPVTSLPVAASPGQVGLELNGSRAVEAVENGLQTESSKDKVKDANGDGNMSDSSSDSEDEESGLAKELCIIQFKEMLKERGVAPFSKWEKELPKIVFDPRFKAIPSHSARRSLFEHYVKTRAEEERKEKRAAQKAATEGFKQLLDEASEDIDHKTDYHTFRKKWGNDPRFQAVDRKDRELLLNERVIPLKKAAEEKVQARRAATASSFKSMLREKGDITMNTRWSRVKDSLRDDPRYKSVRHEDREILFNEYISELKAAEVEAEREAKLKRQEQEKLKERERELRKRKEREEEEMERVRLKVRRKETTSSYQALLVETIKDPQASWTESKPKLEKDPQGRATNPDLDSTDLEKLFREHVKMLHERCANEFRALLAEVLTAEATAQETEDGKTVLNSWSTAKRLLKPDPRYTKMPRKERESLWHRYSEEMQRKQKLALDKKDDHTDGKSKNPIDTGRHPQGARRTQERR